MSKTNTKQHSEQASTTIGATSNAVTQKSTPALVLASGKTCWLSEACSNASHRACFVNSATAKKCWLDNGARKK
eukprot:15472697-Alexandrium_andersonii.AAC.1